MWKNLSPFFLEHGYKLYEPSRHHHIVPPAASKLASLEDQRYPYARRLENVTDNEQFMFHGIQSLRIWAARDKLGREVIIQIICFQGEGSDEAQVYRRLNTLEARRDPRNHTLPVLEWLEYEDKFTFVVVPRWGPTIFGPGFENAAQLLHLGETLLEGLEFLHEHKIAHRDILVQNTVFNLLSSERELSSGHFPHIRNPPEARYAFIDFDSSAIYPMDTDIESVECEREMRVGLAFVGLRPGKCNPFRDDVLVLLRMLERYIRVSCGPWCPPTGYLFDENRKDVVNPPTATQLLQRFRDMKATVTNEQLETLPNGMVWRPRTS
ncbi:other/AgaK1 protein kinase [Coprinopsis sp. MPI-PUGE-AT-0042]|nr:other/AgaK1 protein kinase [Coprinopsis sp. MPI-PUGE-AT-0042]